jgi:hypothetical protein
MRRLVVIGLLGLAIAGCITPSIPIPPPDPSKMDFTITVQDTNSFASLTYPPDHNYAGGTVYVFNHNTGMGVFQDVNADNSIGPTQLLKAAVGNQIEVTVQAAAETVSRCIVLRAGTQDPNTYCSL